MYYGLVYAAIQDVAGPEMRGRAMATYFVVTYLGGASWGPLVTGRLSDFLAHRSLLPAEPRRSRGTARRDVGVSGVGGGAGGGARAGGTPASRGMRNRAAAVRSTSSLVRYPGVIDRKSTRLNSSHANI